MLKKLITSFFITIILLLTLYSLRFRNPIEENQYDETSIIISRKNTYTEASTWKRIGTCLIESLKDKEQYYSFLESPTATCKHMEIMGSYSVCLDHINIGKCLVYSFGLDNDWTFDDTMDRDKGCYVHSFDPTLGFPDHQRTTGIQAYNTGLSNFKGTKLMSYIGRKNITCKVDTLNGIIKRLNHTGKVIDILKMDIEGSELDVLLDVGKNYPDLFQNINQILIEIHTLEDYYWHTGNSRDSTVADYWQVLQLLKCHGFKLIHSNTIRGWMGSFDFKLNGKTRSCCYETTWIKV